MTTIPSYLFYIMLALVPILLIYCLYLLRENGWSAGRVAEAKNMYSDVLLQLERLRDDYIHIRDQKDKYINISVDQQQEIEKLKEDYAYIKKSHDIYRSKAIAQAQALKRRFEMSQAEPRQDGWWLVQFPSVVDLKVVLVNHKEGYFKHFNGDGIKYSLTQNMFTRVKYLGETL